MSGAEIHALIMPKWGLSMTEGTVVDWLVGEGAEVTPRDEVVEIETTKITNVIEAPAAGVLRRRVAGAGETLPVGALLAVVADASVPDDAIDAFIADHDAAEALAADEAEATPAEPTMVEVGGRRLRYLAAGQGDSLPLLLLHGFGGDLNGWMFNQPALAAGRPTYALDLPGHGGSLKEVGEGSLAAFAEAVVGFADALNLARTHLVGHSLGGAVALEAALSAPGRVASLTLIASAGLGSEIDGDYIEGFVAATRRKTIKPFLERLFADASLVTRDLVDDVLKYKRLDGVDAALRTVADAVFPGGRQATVLRDRLSGLAMPVQVIWGAEDRIVPAAHAAGLDANAAVHVVAGAGHMVHMEAAGEVNRLIEAFVRGVG